MIHPRLYAAIGGEIMQIVKEMVAIELTKTIGTGWYEHLDVI